MSSEHLITKVHQGWKTGDCSACGRTRIVRTELWNSTVTTCANDPVPAPRWVGYYHLSSVSSGKGFLCGAPTGYGAEDRQDDDAPLCPDCLLQNGDEYLRTYDGSHWFSGVVLLARTNRKRAFRTMIHDVSEGYLKMARHSGYRSFLDLGTDDRPRGTVHFQLFDASSNPVGHMVARAVENDHDENYDFYEAVDARTVYYDSAREVLARQKYLATLSVTTARELNEAALRKRETAETAEPARPIVYLACPYHDRPPG